jgi:hypothetical protein
MQLIDLNPTASFPAHGYIAATQALLKNTYGVIHKTNSPVDADSINFIGVIINDVTSNVLQYCHLIKSESHRTIWQHCHKPPSFVPYKGAYVPYDGTFGAPDQGQTLDV